MKSVYQLDGDGFYTRHIVLKPNEDIPSRCVEVTPPQGLYKAKWNGKAWVEGLPQEEIAKIKDTPRQKTQLEILQETVDQLVLDNLVRGF